MPEQNWGFVSLDLITELSETLPKHGMGMMPITVYVDKMSKMAHIAACMTKSDAVGQARLLIHRLHGMCRRANKRLRPWL